VDERKRVKGCVMICTIARGVSKVDWRLRTYPENLNQFRLAEGSG